MKGQADIGKLQGALGRVDNAIVYEGLNDIFEIAQKKKLKLISFFIYFLTCKVQLNVVSVRNVL